MRLAHQRDVGFAVAGEIGDAGRIEPAMRAAERRRLGDDFVFAAPLRPMTASAEPRLR